MPNNHKEVQTETMSAMPSIVEQEVTVTLPMPPQPKPPPRSPKVKADSDKIKVAEEKLDVRENLDMSSSEVTELSSGESDETGSEDESVKYDTIKKSDYRRGKVEMPDSAICNGETETAKITHNAAAGDKTEEKATPISDSQKNTSVENVVASSDHQSDVAPEKKLSPSEEVVTTLVNQLVCDSVTLTKETPEQPIAESEVAASGNKHGNGKQKGKRQSSKGSPKKGGKK